MKIMIVDKKKYIVKRIVHDKGNDTFELIPFNEVEYNDVVKDIINAVENEVDAKEVIKSALENLEYEEILDIRKAILKKKKIKSSKGCYEITVGRHSIPIVS